MKQNFALINEKAKQYTLLHTLLSDKGSFKGEYSLRHNQYDENLIILSKFIQRNAGKDIKIITDTNTQYVKMITEWDRFLCEEIDDYVGEQIEKKQYQDQNIKTEKLLGQTQILILQQLIKEKIEELKTKDIPDDSTKNSLLGRQYELEWVLQKINFLSN
ncbi:hypothetical protein MZM54_02315 [[Brevibacterium] frigoritolerans]|nr:hypothetical protein [Peribacillus frigoritolerans]